MGQTLSEPVVEKVSKDGQDDRVVYGVSAMQGWRISMEDAHACILDLKPEGTEKDGNITEEASRISFFGVYDGHGGERVAQYSGEHLHHIVAKQDAFKEKNFEQALKDGFLATDRAILSDSSYAEEVSGCTASVGVITHDKIYCGNSGDSRTVLGIKGTAKPLSFDHKPQNEAEKSRICAAGGFVDFGRVNGNLALSRAIGDFEFKKSAELPPESQIVTAFPDVSVHQISDEDEFLIIACDGIWDCQSSQAVVEFVRRGIVAKQELHAICENMMDNCLASNSETGGVGCDNMTMIIIGLLNGRTKEQWYKLIADRVANNEGPCAPPEYAEFRGPGIHHFDDASDDNYDMEMDHRTRQLAGGAGRIILLGDGTEVLTDSAEGKMVDHDNDDEDLDTQVRRGQGSLKDFRSEREGTPGPGPSTDSNYSTFERSRSPQSTIGSEPDNTPQSTGPDNSDSTDDTQERKVHLTTEMPSSPKQRQKPAQ